LISGLKGSKTLASNGFPGEIEVKGSCSDIFQWVSSENLLFLVVVLGIEFQTLCFLGRLSTA
jgi:hypothetical protein